MHNWKNAYQKIGISYIKLARGECNDQITQFLASINPDCYGNKKNPFVRLLKKEHSKEKDDE